MIKNTDISVVVQGAVDPILTPKALNSIRTVLPGAQIILSTWEGSDVTGLDYDVLVFNKDPGNIKHCPGTFNNMARQIVSVQGGLKKTFRKYTLKLRTDFYLENNSFVKFFTKFPLRINSWTLFNERVVTSSIYARRFALAEDGPVFFPFHPSDLWFFGRTEDIKLLFENLPCPQEPDFSHYGLIYKKIHRFYKDCWWRYSPEQYIFFSAFKRKYPQIVFEDWTQSNTELMQISDQALVNNFIFLGPSQAGIYSDKHLATKDLECLPVTEREGIFSFEVFLQEYKKWVDPAYVFSLREFLGPNLSKLYKHYKNFFQPIERYTSRFCRWAGEFFAIMGYACKIAGKTIYYVFTQKH